MIREEGERGGGGGSDCVGVTSQARTPQQDAGSTACESELSMTATPPNRGKRDPGNMARRRRSSLVDKFSSGKGVKTSVQRTVQWPVCLRCAASSEGPGCGVTCHFSVTDATPLQSPAVALGARRATLRQMGAGGKRPCGEIDSVCKPVCSAPRHPDLRERARAGVKHGRWKES